jgi:hypothetical protein
MLMTFRTLLGLVSSLALLALGGCKDKDGGDSAASLNTSSSTLPA